MASRGPARTDQGSPSISMITRFTRADRVVPDRQGPASARGRPGQSTPRELTTAVEAVVSRFDHRAMPMIQQEARVDQAVGGAHHHQRRRVLRRLQALSVLREANRLRRRNHSGRTRRHDWSTDRQ